MGLSQRRRSGKIIGGSSMIVPGQDVYTVKVFSNGFEYKRGSGRQLVKEYNLPVPPPPIPPQNIINAILVDQTTYLAIDTDVYFIYVD